MQKTRAIFAGAVIVAGAVGWYLFRPEKLFTSSTIDEPFVTQEATAMPTPELAMASEEAAMAAAGGSVPAIVMADAAVDVEAVALVKGQFHSNAHPTSGTATIYRLDSGKRVLRLENLATSDGPDVRVYLVAAPDVNDNDVVKKAGFVELGKLKATMGNQNYDVPASVDLARYRTVTIWCKRFSVNFGSAPLADVQSKS